MSTAAVVLAAGASRRLGRSKQLEPWGDSNLLSNVVTRTREFPVDEVWVVLGHDYERILEETELADAGVIENPEWAEGIASSIRVALDALTRLSRADKALIVLGDQPSMPVEVVEELMASHAKSDSPVSVPKYRYNVGQSGDRGPRSVAPSDVTRRRRGGSAALARPPGVGQRSVVLRSFSS